MRIPTSEVRVGMVPLEPSKENHPRQPGAGEGRVAGDALFRVGGEIDKGVVVSLNFKIETPSAIHPCLPNIPCLVVLFCAERGVFEIREEEHKAPVKCALNTRRRTLVALPETFGVDGTHYAGLRFLRSRTPARRERIISFAEGKGP